jgi:restriction system protein
MGYKKYGKEPYEKLSKEWEEYKENIEGLNKFLEYVYYDGADKNCLGTIEEISRYPQYAIKEKGELSSKSFCLPCAYPILDLDQLFEPTTPPNFPVPKSTPLKTILEEHEYPDWYIKFTERDIKERESLKIKMSEIVKLLNEKQNNFQSLYQELLNSYKNIKQGLHKNDSLVNAKLIELANLKNPLPRFLKTPLSVGISTESRIAIIQFKFPDYQSEDIVIGYKKVKWENVPKFATETAKKKIVKQTLYSLIIRSAYIAAKHNFEKLFDSVVINVEQDWFDPATGQPRNGIIASLQAPVEYLQSLDLSKLDPEVCFKYLKGISTPNLQNASPIRPIFTLNKEDERLVANKDVDSEMESEANLAAMEWEDFEHLVAQLFEWEFSKNGIEVKVTRASRDRGVDAILFDPDPLKGGKYVIQAKRYTRTVDVSAVRDLYGTVMNEGANRGILITTASYGPDAYEFANGKPISLVDGPNLLLMLQRHGKKFKIDLEEARRLNAINQNSN